MDRTGIWSNLNQRERQREEKRGDKWKAEGVLKCEKQLERKDRKQLGAIEVGISHML